MPAPRLSHVMSTGIALVAGILGLSVLQGAHLLGGTPAVAELAQPPRPNIVVVMTDDMRADDIRFMPTVRRQLRARGLTFRNSFSPYPLCCPARASFLTGQYAHNHHVLGNQAPFGFGAFDDSVTLATSLSAAGYNTGYVGKYLNGYGSSPSQVTGLPSLGYVPPGWTDWYAALQPPKGSGIRGSTYNYMRTPYNINGRVDTSHAGEYQTVTLGRFARTLTRRYAGSDKPFFLFMTPLAPHNGKPREKGDDLGIRPIRRGAWGTPARPRWTRDMFSKLVRTSPGLPKNGGPSEADISDKPAFLHTPELTRAEKRAEMLMTRQRGQALFALDREIGRLIATLEDRGELASTVLMFTSDNGYLLGEHRIRAGKSHAYEPSIRVPLVLAGPGVPYGIRNDPATTFDVSATILDLAGAESPHEADGRSLVGSFDADRGWDFPVVTEAMLDRKTGSADGFGDARTTIGIRTARWKLIRHKSGAVELYDLDNDPYELRNVAGLAAYAEVRQALTDLWWKYKDCQGAECRDALPARFRLSASELAVSTRTQSGKLRQRHGVTF